MKKLFTAILLIAFAICTAFAFTACNEQNDSETPNEDKEFVITTNITDGAEVEEQEYTFTASATYGGEACAVEVTLNGTIVEGNGTYTVQLIEGENIICVTAKSGDDSEIKTYKVTYTVPEIPAVFEVTTDLESAAIINDVIAFTASATCNGEPCNVVVTFNGAPLTAGDNGKYSAQLSIGENAFGIIARSGDNVDEKNITIKYECVELVTSLADCDVTEKNYSFTASATYGEANCEVEVSLNGDIIEPSGSEYKVTLVKGENTIIVKAECGRVSKEFAYTVNYQTTPPTISTSITDNSEIRSSIYNFEVIAHDSVGRNISSNVAFTVDWNADDNEENFVTVKGIMVVWADSDKTSYSIDFTSGDFAEHSERAFIFKITATDSLGESASIEYKLIYIPAEEDESIGKVVFSIEGFTIGMGYFVEPMWVPIYDGVNGAQMLTDIITEYGWDCDYTGRIESGFYLSAIKGLDLTGNEIPDELWEYVEYMGYERTYDESENARWGLGEFCYGYGSGWMYSVNGSFYNYGFSDYVPQDGDVVRIVFTLMLGSDVGGGGALGGGYGGDSWLDEDVDYAEIMMLLADIRSQENIDLTVYYEAIESISVWNIKQYEMDYWVETLRESYGK